MEIFRIVKTSLTIAGLLKTSDSSRSNYRPILIFVAISVMAYADLTTAWYFLFEAETFVEHAQTIPLMEGFIGMNVQLYVILWRRAVILKFVEKLQYKMNKRK